MELNIPFKSKKTILALGPESAGNFSVYKNGQIFFSDDYGDLTDETNFEAYKSDVLKYLKVYGIKPDVILTDLHPLYVTTVWGVGLAKKHKAKHIQVQHHIAHIFSTIGEKSIDNRELKIDDCLGIACDGTGYGEDGKIWGGEVFQLSIINDQLSINRVGHLENQVMIGGDMAVREPGRMLLAVLSKFLGKDDVCKYIKKYYSKNKFEVLFNQLKHNFNCQETSSTGRVLDAVSMLLGFCGNKRNYKHEPAELLENNSTKPYKLAPLIKVVEGIFVLETTSLFSYLIKNPDKDKKRLAATAQMYIAQGLFEIIRKTMKQKNRKTEVFFAGGMANNKIMSEYLEAKGVYVSKKIYSADCKLCGVPRGDAGLSFGQIIYYLCDYNMLP